MSPPIFMSSELDLAVESILDASLTSSTSSAKQRCMYSALDSEQHSGDVDVTSPSVQMPEQMSFSPFHPLDGRNSRFLPPDTEPDLPSSSAEDVANDLIQEAVIATAFEMHRMAKLGLLFLYQNPELAELETDRLRRSPEKRRSGARLMKVCTTAGCDVFGVPLSSSSKAVRQQECPCPQCGRSMSASRFAPHLEKCMGMGRNSSRVASRRILSRTQSHSSSVSLHASGSVSYNQSEESDDEDGDSEGMPGALGEDEDWLEMRRRRPRRRVAQVKRTERKRAPPPVVPDGLLLDDLLEAPSSQSNVVLGGLMEDESELTVPSPVGTETLRLRSRTVRKTKPKESPLSLSGLDFSDNSRDGITPDDFLSTPNGNLLLSDDD